MHYLTEDNSKSENAIVYDYYSVTVGSGWRRFIYGNVKKMRKVKKCQNNK